MPPTPVFWHGSRTALRVGEVLLPDNQRNPTNVNALDPADMYGYNQDRIYITTDRELARAWVARRRNGCLLRVEPNGPMEDDPDFPRIAFATTSATVTAVEEHPITMTRLAARKAFATPSENATTTRDSSNHQRRF